MARVILIGEPMALFTAKEEGKLDIAEHFNRSAAGAEMNVAIGLRRLGHNVSYITKLGEDPFGKYLMEFLEKQGIDTQYITFDNHFPTGIQVKSNNPKGDPDTVYYRHGSAASNLKIDDVEDIRMENYDHFHLTGIFPAISSISRATLLYLVQKAKYMGLTTSFDPNLRPSLWENEETMIKRINHIAFKCDVVLPGISEGRILTGYENEVDIANFYLSHGIKVVVIKLGPKGAYVKTQLEEGYINGYYVSEIVDTVGAGDGFAVGYISGILERMSLKHSVQRANAIGALQVMNIGDNEGLPDREQLKNFMESN